MTKEISSYTLIDHTEWALSQNSIDRTYTKQTSPPASELFATQSISSEWSDFDLQLYRAPHIAFFYEPPIPSSFLCITIPDEGIWQELIGSQFVDEQQKAILACCIESLGELKGQIAEIRAKMLVQKG